MYQRILSDPLNFPPDVAPDARGIMTGLLQRNPAHRLGANGAEDIKRHPFFSKHIDWTRLLQRKIQPPFKPNVVRIFAMFEIVRPFTHIVGVGPRRGELRHGVHE
jgi:serum/glucocorticoid-regulated kinase 2